MAGVRLNVELKARCADLGLATERCAAIGAAAQGVLEQRDTYFSTVRGRLKLRQLGNGTSELLAYERVDDPEATESSYLLVPVPTPHELTEALVAKGRVGRRLRRPWRRTTGSVVRAWRRQRVLL